MAQAEVKIKIFGEEVCLYDGTPQSFLSTFTIVYTFFLSVFFLTIHWVKFYIFTIIAFVYVYLSGLLLIRTYKNIRKLQKARRPALKPQFCRPRVQRLS